MSRDPKSSKASAKKTDVHIVVGTGRSGTSLVTQVLEELGATPADDQVPASENNLRGTGESIALRDLFTKLKNALGPGVRVRPSGWEQHPATQEARATLSRYLKEQATRAGKFGFVAKFPLGSLYIPLWEAAATDAGVTPHFVWATRPVAKSMRSMVDAYSSEVSDARIKTLERLFRIFRDSTDSTLLLPYEGWSKNPQVQVDALADLIGQKDKKRRIAAAGTFAPSLDHSGASRPTNTVEVEDEIDALLTGKLGPLGKNVDRRSVEYLTMMASLSGEIYKRTTPALRSPFDGEMDVRLELLAALDAQTDEDSPEMNEQIQILTTRIREVTAENQDLRTKAKNSDGATALAALRDEHVAEIERLSKALDEAKEAQDASQQAYVKLAHERDRLEEETESRFALKFQDLENREARIRQRAQAQAVTVKKLQQQRDRFRNSVSWRITRPVRFIGRVFKGKKKAK